VKQQKLFPAALRIAGKLFFANGQISVAADGAVDG
jgi:hypothetical protein